MSFERTNGIICMGMPWSDDHDKFDSAITTPHYQVRSIKYNNHTYI